MSIFAAILQSAETDNWNSVINDAVFTPTYGGGRTTSSGKFITPDAANTLGAYFACKRVISEDIATLPRKAFIALPNGDNQPQPDHPVQQFLSGRWNDWLPSGVGFQTLQDWALGWGNGYAEIEWDNTTGQFKAAYPIHPSRCEPKATDSGGLVYQIINDDGTTVYLQPEDIIHIRGIGDQFKGYSICRLAADAIGAAISAQEFAGAFWKGGTAITGVIKHPGELDEVSVNRLRQQWIDMYGGTANAGKPAVLEEGMDYARIGIPPEEAQFLETRYYDKEEQCTWFRVNPNKIQVWNKANYNTFEAANIDHVGFTLLPWVKRWEDEINYKLFLPSERATHYAEFNLRAMLRGDIAAQTEHLRAMFNIGVYSQNDIRRLLGENGIGPDGDVYYVALNIGPSDKAATGELIGEKKGSSPGSDAGGNSDAKDSSQFLERATQILTPTLDAFCKKETKARANAKKKHADDDVQFSLWLAEFQTGNDSQLVAALTPQILALSEMRSSPLLATTMLQIESKLSSAITTLPILTGEHDAETRAAYIVAATLGAV